jgi:hypothetical protein
LGSKIRKRDEKKYIKKVQNPQLPATATETTPRSWDATRLEGSIDPVLSSALTLADLTKEAESEENQVCLESIERNWREGEREGDEERIEPNFDGLIACTGDDSIIWCPRTTPHTVFVGVGKCV